MSTTLLLDNFNGNSLNTSIWGLPPAGKSSYVPRTQFIVSGGTLPQVRDGKVRLALNSYSPPGSSFTGTELVSNQTFSVTAGTGLDVQFTAKLDPPILGGAVGGLFLYMLKPNGTDHDEIDTELESNHVVTGTNQVETNVYADQPTNTAGAPEQVNLPRGGSLTGYHTYEMRWYGNGSVSWFIDGKLVRTEKTVVPSGPMQLYLNLWAPASTWPDAYNSQIQPTNNLADNVRFNMDVSRVLVKSFSIASTAPAPSQPVITITSVPNLGATGNATGQVTGVNLADYAGVAVYIQVNGDWWTKPTFDDPLTTINSDGSWTTDITTGGDDPDATQITAYLIPNNFDVPLADDTSILPPSLAPLLHATVSR